MSWSAVRHSVLLAWLTAGLGGCVFIPVNEVSVPRGAPDSRPAETPRAAPTAAARPNAAPPRAERKAHAAHAEAPAPPVVPKRVVILLPERDSGFESTLPALESDLAARGFEVDTVAGSKAAARLPAAKTGQATYAIAVGREAVAIGMQLRLPTVYCQVASPMPPDAADHLHGVAALPPLALQLRAWRELSPRLRRVALILGPGREQTATEAKRAAELLSVSLVYRIASSDQEAVYLFKRLAPQVDGLWMLPDNSVLSPRAIKSMLNEAARYKVQSMVFTPALLDWGGLLSVSSTSRDLARTLADVVDRLATHPQSVPSLTPLSELELEVNEATAARFDIRAPSRSRIVRGETW